MAGKQRKFKGITLDVALDHLEQWLEAELEITTHQSYRLQDQTLTMADLGQVRKQIEYWNGMVEKLKAREKSGGRNRFYHSVPRDY